MAGYFIDFTRYCFINAEEAQDIFWECIRENKPLLLDAYGIEKIQRMKEK